MTGPPKIPQADWDKHKAYLHDLFITRDKTLSQVIQQAENEQGFRPSKAQYIRQFKKWNFEKNLRGDQWKRIAKVLRNRKTHGKDSEILIKDGRVSDGRLRKEMSRYRPHEHDDCSDLTFEDMDGIIIGTPQGEVVQVIDYLQIPWFQFQTLIEPYFDKMRRRDSGLALSNPSVPLAPDTMQNGPPTEALRLLAQCTSKSTNANDIIETLYYDLKDVTIEMPDHERAENLVHRTGPLKLDQMVQFIRYFVYLSSNNLVDDGRIDKLVEWMVESKTQWVLDPLLDLRTPTTEIFGSNIFVSAARLGETDVVRGLIATGIDVHASAGSPFQRTALEVAVISQHPRVVELLLNAGADPESRMRSGCSLLITALAGPHKLEMLSMLVNKGADVNAAQDGYRRPRSLLPLAIHDGDHEVTRFLLGAGVNIDKSDALLGTALRTAAAHEDVEAVQMLVDAGADIDAPTGDSARGTAESLTTPIQQASLTGNAEIVQILVSEGANVNAFLWDCNHALESRESYRKYHWERRDGFEEHYQHITMTPLQAAVFRRDPVIVQMLLDAGAHVDEKSYGDTPLQMAAVLDETRIMHILRRHGADVNAPAGYYGGMTALQAAARAGNCKLVQEMLVSGSEINAAASFYGGRTALQAAAESGNVDLAKILIEAGAIVNADASPNSGRTSLQAAVEHGHVEMVFMLLNEGADVNGSAAITSGGLTALQAALWQLGYNEEGPDVENDDEELDIDDEYEASDIRKTKQPRDTILQALFDAGADISAPSSAQGCMTTIVAAVKTGRPDVVRWCLQGGADPNISDGGTTALGAAVYQDSIKLVSLLIEGGADVNAYCEMYYYTNMADCLPQWSALHIAARTGATDIANLLLGAGAEINMPHPRPNSLTTLQSAISNYDTTMVQFLLDKGANPHIWGTDSPETSMSYLRGSFGLKILNALAVAGGDFNRMTDAYKLVFEKQDMQNVVDSGTLMYWTGEQKGHLLQAAIKQGHCDLIQGMLDAGADVNTPAAYCDGRTALQKAASEGCTDIVALLLSYGADVNAPAGYMNGGSALQKATEEGSTDIVTLLLSYGADVNAIAGHTYDKTALQIAVEKGCTDIVALLLSYGADVNAPAGYAYSRTALQGAAEKGCTDIVTLLLSHGADVNAPAGYCGGITALQGAALNGNLKIVFILLKAGAEINAAPAVEDGRTALQAAAEHGHLDIVSLLLENDHDTGGMELRCQSAALFAEREGHKIIARVLRQHKAGQGNTE